MARPLAARTQQPVMPVVGFLFSSTSKPVGAYIAGLTANGRGSLRAAAGSGERSRFVTASNAPPALAAKAATQAVPIVFMMGADPVKSGLVPSLARPGENITGVTVLAGELTPKRLALPHELVPAAATMAYLYNSATLAYNSLNFAFTEALKEMTEEVASSRLGVRLLTLTATNPSEIEHAFATLAEQRVGALLVGPDTFFTAQRAQIVALAARYRVPASYARREFIEAGGLMSYAASFGEAYRQAGVYVGRILSGEKPGDLPVQEPTRYEFLVNLKTARTLDLNVPPNLLALADEVIE